MSTLAEQIYQLETAIAMQETLRPTLGDAVVEVTLRALVAQLEALRAQQNPAFSLPNGSYEILSRLQSYLPKELANKMHAVGRIEGERKQVTVMFADLSGFTALSERLELEKVTTLTNDALKELAKVVYQYEGYIDKFIGDEVMAVFGAPIAHEDDPARALRAALAMREHMASFNRRWIELLGQPLALHIGINTGMVIAGNVGSDLRMSYTVMGDTVNIASRLQDVAQPGQILASRYTYRLTHEAFDFAALDPIMVKGKCEPLLVYELQRAKLQPGKSRGLKNLAPAFVGRERELARLREVMSELEQGRGRIVSINGEAGIGKSRLLTEWRAEATAGERTHWIEGHAFAHTTSLAYGPFLDMLRRFAGITDDDSEAKARARLDAAIERFFPNQTEAHAVFANLLALRLAPDEEALLARLPSEALRRHMFALVAKFFEWLARERPTIFILEDTHWTDYTSLELIESLLPLARQLPLALVGVHRLHPSDRLNKLRLVIETRYADIFTDIPIRRLLETDSILMTQRLLSISTIPEALHMLILRKAEGNPFFVEEMIRSLIERGALMRSDEDNWTTTPLMETITVPGTVQGVLMARLDSLPDETKWVVQQASVIGRIFLYRVLLQISDTGIDTNLSQLEREQLILERARLPEIEYIFKHALTQEVAYQSLLTPRRKELHHKVGKAMEVIFAERLAEFQNIIGEHFFRGETWDEASGYLIKAGDMAAHLYAHAEARVHYASALEALAHLPDTEDYLRRRVDTLVKQVSVSIVADEPERNLERLAMAESLAKELHGPEGTKPDRRRLAHVHYWMGRAYYYGNKMPEAMVYFRQALPAAREFNDAELLGISSMMIGRAVSMQGRFNESEMYLAQAVSPLEQIADWMDWVFTTAFLGFARAARGNYAAGLVDAESALSRAQEINNPTAIGMSHILLSLIHLMGGNWRAMLDEAYATIEAAQQAGDRLYVYIGYGFRSISENLLGNFKDAHASAKKRREVAQNLGGHLIGADWCAAFDAEIAMNLGCVEDAISLAQQAANIAQVTGGLLGGGWAHRAWGRALARLTPPQWDEAEAHLAESLRLLESGDARLEAARTHVVWGNICRERMHHDAAQEHFEKASAQFKVSELNEEMKRARALTFDAIEASGA